MITEAQLTKAFGESIEINGCHLNHAALRLIIQLYKDSEWIEFDPDDESTWPVIGRRVIVDDEGGYGVLSARLGTVGWYLESDKVDNYANITRWQPLPEGPRT